MLKLIKLTSIFVIGCIISTGSLQAKNEPSSKIIGLKNENRIKNNYIVVFKSSAKSRKKEVSSSIVRAYDAKIKRIYNKALNGMSIEIPDASVELLAKNVNLHPKLHHFTP